MVKRKQKKVLKQKQKVKVSQNVKVVIGDVKRKRAVKSSGVKAAAKPPVVLNISNPQPLNNAFMEYFRQQLKNQQPIKGNTLKQNEHLNEREENKASRAGTLHRLDQEPNDVAREMNRQGEALQARIKQAEDERRTQTQEITNNLRSPPPTSGRKNRKRKTRLVLDDDNSNPFTPLAQEETEEERDGGEGNILNALQQQQSAMEAAITKGGAGAGGDDEADGEAQDDTQTDTGGWLPTDEEPLGEIDSLYGKQPEEIKAYLEKYNITYLRGLAKENRVPYSRGRAQLGKPDLIKNFQQYLRNSTPLPRPGRPKKDAKK